MPTICSNNNNEIKMTSSTNLTIDTFNYSNFIMKCDLMQYENIRFPERSYTSLPYIKKVEILKPNKVIRFTFYPVLSLLSSIYEKNEKVIKTICLDEDTFDFEFSFYLAYAKYMYGNILTPHGIEKKAREFMDNKDMIKLVKKGMKVYRDQVKEEERIAKEKKIKESARLNKIAKKKAKKAKAKEARIAEIAEAINRTK